MSKQLKLIIVLLFLMVLAACDTDPYKGKRPIDYPNTTWNCNQGLLRFSVNEYKDTINAILITKDESVSVRFLWSKLNAKVTIIKNNDKNESLFSANATYGELSFSLDITDTKGYLKQPSIVLVCDRE